MAASFAVGTVVGFDATLADADQLRDFYAEVVGWEPRPVDMGGYDDYQMHASDGSAVAGICHARGQNVDQPAGWVPYIRVADLEASLAACEARGGRRVTAIKGDAAHARFCLIRDPAGAAVALMEMAGE